MHDDTNPELAHGNGSPRAEGGSGLNRRNLFQKAGTGIAGAVAVSALATGGSMLASTPAHADATLDAEILNFALNLEYLEAEYYLRAIGQTLAGNNITLSGVGTQGTVNGGAQVPFKSTAIQQYASRIAVDELSHVRFLRIALGSAAVAEPSLDISTGPTGAFTVLARAAGLISSSQTFNPYADDVSFLLGAAVFEDVGVTAYAGAAALITNSTYLTAAAGILAVEAYHSGAIRTLLGDLGAGVAFDAISNLRGALSAAIVPGAPAEQPLLIPGNNYNFVANDINGLAFRRTPAQVLNIVYGGGQAGIGGLFFPNGLNGALR